MGKNYKFRFSDMIPNAWFYKLKDMNSSNRNHPKPLNPTHKKKHSPSSSSLSSSVSSSAPLTDKSPHLSEQRKSYHFTRDLTFEPIHKTLPDKPRNSFTRRRRRNRRHPPAISAGCSCRASLESKPHPEDSGNSSPFSSDPDSVLTEYGSSADNDVVIELDNPRLPSIITKKSETNQYGSLSVKVVKENFVNSATPVRRISVSPGVRLRTTSPRMRIQGRRSSGASRRSVTESVAVVKSSKDPRRDFRESMVEMIVENDIRASKDLEELLACYLSLNSDEYHDLIVNVFKQIWFDFIHVRLK